LGFKRKPPLGDSSPGDDIGQTGKTQMERNVATRLGAGPEMMIVSKLAV
jgi:hypothetical protein